MTLPHEHSPPSAYSARNGETHIETGLIGTILLFALVYVLPLALRPLVGPDELRYSEIPREMILSGDWVVPRLNGLRYFEKPPLGYWAIASSMLAFGENAFATKLPSALSVGLSGVLIAVKTVGLHSVHSGISSDCEPAATSEDHAVQDGDIQLNDRPVGMITIRIGNLTSAKACFGSKDMKIEVFRVQV